MSNKLELLKDDERYGKFDQVLDLLFCISSVIFAFSIPFQFKFTPWIAHWFWAVLIFKIYYVLRGKERIISITLKESVAILSLGCFGVWALLSTKWSMDPDNTYKMAISWLSPFLIIPGIYIFSCRRLPISLMMKAYVCGCTVLTIYALTDLTETALNGDVNFYLDPRLEIMDQIASVTYHHIYLGFILAVSLFISAKFIFDSKTPIWEKIFFAIHSALALFLLAIDNSRIVTLALFISTFIFFVIQIKKNKKIALLILAVFTILTIIFIAFPTRLGESVMKITENGDADDPRFHIWKALFAGIKDVPFLGYGYSAIDNVYADLFQKAECWMALNSHYTTHNQFMEAFYTLGYLGFSFVITFLIGIVLLIKEKKSLSLASLLILLLVTMMFEIPFCSFFVIPLLIAWYTFCYSGKTDMEVELPKFSFVIPTITAMAFAGIIAVDSCKSIKKYSKAGAIEISDFSKKKFTKKSLKTHKITDNNIDMIISKGKSGSIITLLDKARDSRTLALTNTTDSLLFTVDYLISEDFSANQIFICSHALNTNNTLSVKILDLAERNVWKSDTMLIKPSCTKTDICKTNQTYLTSDRSTATKTFIQTDLHNAKTFNDLKGYALFRNMKIVSLNKVQYDR